jgi:rfaE bifunctional protein nucleotidyltransferase chain/domain
MDALRHPAVVDLPPLLSAIAPLREAGRRIVFTNGCFDILHPGHADLLARARALGDALVLGLNSDGSVRRQNKGAGRPFNPWPARAFVLAHLRSVDFVTPFEEDTPLELIRAVRPHVLVKGGDWETDAIAGRELVTAGGGQVFSLPLLPGWSTTALARRVADAGGSGERP